MEEYTIYHKFLIWPFWEQYFNVVDLLPIYAYFVLNILGYCFGKETTYIHNLPKASMAPQ